VLVGNPLLLEQVGLEAEIRKMEALKEAHINQRFQGFGAIARFKESPKEQKHPKPP